MMEFPVYLPHDKLKSSLEKAYGSPLEITSVETTLPNLGKHFISSVANVDVKVKYANSNDEKEVQLFVKYSTTDESRKELNKVMNPYEKEDIFYGYVLPSLKNFIAEKNAEMKLDYFPRCFYTEYDQLYNPVVLENLKQYNFSLHPSDKNHDTDHVRLVLKNMAEFHAVSSVFLRKTNNDIVVKYPSLSVTSFSKETEATFGSMHVDYYKTGISVLDSDEYRDVFVSLNRITDRMHDRFRRIEGPLDPFNCICLGDCWNTNFMFKYDENNKPIEMKFLDFQLIRYDTIAYDFSFYITTTSDPALWRTQFKSYLKFYYDTFTSTLHKFNEKCLFSFDEFEVHIRTRFPVVFPIMFSIISIRYLPDSCFTDPSEVKGDDVDLKDEFTSAVSKMTSTDDWREILQQLVLACFEEGKIGIKTLGNF